VSELFTFVEWNPEKAEQTGYSNYSYWRSTFRTFINNRLSLFLLITIGTLVLMSLIYPVLASIDPNKVDLDSSLWNQRPSLQHLFGTDGLGRDMWARTWYGTRTSILLAFTIAFFVVVNGVCAG
jgi:oligopeptide transport system permease protein